MTLYRTHSPMSPRGTSLRVAGSSHAPGAHSCGWQSVCSPLLDAYRLLAVGIRGGAPCRWKFGLALAAVGVGGSPAAPVADPVERIALLPPGPGNPRNSEGDFVQLKDGRVMLVYTRFTGGGSDDSAAHLAARFSADGGRTWTKEDLEVVGREGTMNVMSVSLLRLQDGRLALFYARKNSLVDCRPWVRFSTDEANTWSEPVPLVPDSRMGYYVLNNDRVVQLRSGRLVVPLSQHNAPGWKAWTGFGIQLCYLSDDNGTTWRRSKTVLTGEQFGGKRVVLQEPGVVELRDGRLLMFSRSTAGCQYVSFSRDGGETWTKMKPSSIISPCSPASIERIPSTGDLLLVWNDHSKVPQELKDKRTPLTVAVSRDEGRTWQHAHTLYDDPRGWYCYTAVEFVGQYVLLAHCAGHRHLAQTNITRFPVKWLYEPATR